MKEKVQAELSKLIGKQLSVSHRSLNLECFHFGELRKVQKGVIGEFGLHVQCDWRIHGNEIIVGSKDLDYQPNGDYDSSIDWDNETLRDVKLRALIQGEKLIVSEVSADELGGFQITFSNKLIFEVLPVASSKDWSNEYWRLLTLFEDKDNEHFVVGAAGCEN